MIRVILPTHLRTMAHVGSEVTLEVVILKTRPGHAALGAGRAPLTEKCGPLSYAARRVLGQPATTTRNSAGRSCLCLRFFAYEEDLSHNLAVPYATRSQAAKSRSSLSGPSRAV